MLLLRSCVPLCFVLFSFHFASLRILDLLLLFCFCFAAASVHVFLVHHQAIFEKKAETFAQRQRQEEGFASRDTGASAGARGTVKSRSATRPAPRRAASGGSPPYSPLKLSASGAGTGKESAHGRRPLRAASSPETGVSYRPPEIESLSSLPVATSGGVGGVGDDGGGDGGRGDGSSGAIDRDQQSLPAVGGGYGSAGGVEGVGGLLASSSAGDPSGEAAAAAAKDVSAVAAAEVSAVAAAAIKAVAATATVADGDKPDAAGDSPTPATTVGTLPTTMPTTTPATVVEAPAMEGAPAMETGSSGNVARPEQRSSFSSLSSGGVAAKRKESVDAMAGMTAALAVGRVRRNSTSSLKRGATPALALAHALALAREKQARDALKQESKAEPATKPELKVESSSMTGRVGRGDGEKPPERRDEPTIKVRNPSEENKDEGGDKTGSLEEARPTLADPTMAGPLETAGAGVDVVASGACGATRNASSHAELPGGGGDAGGDANVRATGEGPHGGINVGGVERGTVAAAAMATAVAATEKRGAVVEEGAEGGGRGGAPKEVRKQDVELPFEENEIGVMVEEMVVGAEKLVEVTEVEESQQRGENARSGGREPEAGATLTETAAAAVVAAATVNATMGVAVSSASTPAAAVPVPTAALRASRVSWEGTGEGLTSAGPLVRPPLPPLNPMAAAEAMEAGAGEGGVETTVGLRATEAQAAEEEGAEVENVPNIVISQPLLTSPSLRDCAWSGATPSTGSPPAMMAKLAYHHHVESPAVESAFDVASDTGSSLGVSHGGGSGSGNGSERSYHGDVNDNNADGDADGDVRESKEGGYASSSATAETVSPRVMTAVAVAMTTGKSVTVSTAASATAAAAAGPRTRAESASTAAMSAAATVTTAAPAVVTTRRRTVSDDGGRRTSDGSDLYMTPMGDTRASVFWPPPEEKQEEEEEGKSVGGRISPSVDFPRPTPPLLPPPLQEGEEETAREEEGTPGEMKRETRRAKNEALRKEEEVEEVEEVEGTPEKYETPREKKESPREKVAPWGGVIAGSPPTNGSGKSSTPATMDGDRREEIEELAQAEEAAQNDDIGAVRAPLGPRRSFFPDEWEYEGAGKAGAKAPDTTSAGDDTTTAAVAAAAAPAVVAAAVAAACGAAANSIPVGWEAGSLTTVDNEERRRAPGTRTQGRPRLLSKTSFQQNSDTPYPRADGGDGDRGGRGSIDSGDETRSVHPFLQRSSSGVRLIHVGDDDDSEAAEADALRPVAGAALGVVAAAVAATEGSASRSHATKSPSSLKTTLPHRLPGSPSRTSSPREVLDTPTPLPPPPPPPPLASHSRVTSLLSSSRASVSAEKVSAARLPESPTRWHGRLVAPAPRLSSGIGGIHGGSGGDGFVGGGSGGSGGGVSPSGKVTESPWTRGSISPTRRGQISPGRRRYGSSSSGRRRDEVGLLMRVRIARDYAHARTLVRSVAHVSVQAPPAQSGPPSWSCTARTFFFVF